MTEGPYSRVYWAVLDDRKFDAIRADMRHFGSWTLMLVVADMAYPAPAFIPPSVPKGSLTALVDAKLIELLPARMYRIKGLKSERESRSERGKAGAAARWQSNANALRPQTDGNATGLLDETSKEETRRGIDEAETTARDSVDPDEGGVFAFLAQHGAAIRPDAPLGRRLLGLMARRGAAAVLKEAEDMAKTEAVMSDRQWVLGLENGLEAIPTGRKSVDEAIHEETAARTEARSAAIFDRMTARRLDYYRNTGLWPEEWGERPAA